MPTWVNPLYKPKPSLEWAKPLTFGSAQIKIHWETLRSGKEKLNG